MLFDADINYLAVILGAIAAQPLGVLWYSRLFGTRWMELRGYTEADVAEGGRFPYVIGFLAPLVVAYTLARLVDMVGADSVGECVAIAAFVWAGFAATVQATQIAFSPRGSLGLFGIEGGFQLTSFVIIGVIVGLFQ
jgi:uncharacterized protein DUF1761